MRRTLHLGAVLVALMAVSATPAASERARVPEADAGPARSHPACSIAGTNGSDRLVGTSGADVICARGGDDRVFGRGGNDVLVLGPGNDTFSAGPGDDRVFAGPGRDWGNGGSGDDRIFLQRGNDGSENWSGVDLVVGGRGDDDMCAYDHRPNAPIDRVRGGPGPDYAGVNPGDLVRSVRLVFYGGCWD
jgi:Ca2+-binding RTX toxin-like protein